MTWVNSGGIVTGGAVQQSAFASEAELQALKTDGGAGGSVVVTATGSTTARTLAARAADAVNAKDFGAVGDGTADDTVAVQAAVTYCVANNRDLNADGIFKLTASINIDRLVDSAAADKYFTIFSDSGGGFLVSTAIAMFSSSLTFTTAPVTQLTKFQGVSFEASNAALASYVLDDARFLRTQFEGCSFRAIKLLSAPTVFIQSLYLMNCQARRWNGTFLSSKNATFDLKVTDCLLEAGGDGFDIDFPVGSGFVGCTIEGMVNFAIKYVGAYGFTIASSYFEGNGLTVPGGTSVDGTATGADGSQAVSISGNYFSGDGVTTTKPQVIWGDITAGLSSGNNCTTTLHAFTSGSRVSVVGDFATTALSVAGAKFYLRPPSPAATGGITLDGVNVGIGTDTAAQLLHVHGVSAKPKVYISDPTLGTGYGGYITGYGVGGLGGYVALGTVQNFVPSEALRITEVHNVEPFADGTQSLGSAANRWNVIYGLSLVAYGGVSPGTITGGAGTSKVFMGAAAPAAGTFVVGDRVINNVPSVGQPKAWGCTAAGTPGTWVSEGLLTPLDGLVSTDRGDSAQTLTVTGDNPVQRWATTLTANRIVTLSTTGAVNGNSFRVVRTGLGAFTLDVGGLKTIPNSTAAFVDASYNGSAWVLTGYGLL